jgi:L-ascorbate metabolism protein UlaG (beta-lactamase superfamily)
MNIIWKGQSCFQILAQKNKIPANIVIDPFSQETGLRPPSQPADIVLVSQDNSDNNNVAAVGGNPFVVSGPGEYEVKEIYIKGVLSADGASTIYIVEAEDLKICHLGDLNQNELTAEQLEKIGEVDILMIPVGGGTTITEREALKIMAQIEPKITIPMHYAIPKLKAKLAGVEGFLKALGMKSIQPEDKLSIKKKDILPDEAKVVVLQP